MYGQSGYRDIRIDFFRGLALLTIFINHIPGNFYSKFTHQNFGFSDSAEIFVFLAGFVAALAYFPRFMQGQALPQSYRAVRRAGQIYMAHIVSVVAAIALFALAAEHFGNPALARQINIAPILDDPARGLLGVVLMSHQLGFFNILPMYVVFLVILPVIMLLARVDLRLALGASGALYLANALFGLNMPQYPTGGSWFFNPIAWQFLFTLGFVAGALARQGTPVPFHRTIFWAAAGFLALSLFWRIAGFHLPAAYVPWPEALFGFSKTHEALFRLVHVLALIYVFVYSPLGALARRIPADNIVAVVGRHSLPIFCAGSLLSMTGFVLRTQNGGSFVIDTVVTAAGIAVMVGLARIMEWNRTAGQRKTRPAQSASVSENGLKPLPRNV